MAEHKQLANIYSSHEFSFLKDVYQLLADGNVLGTSASTSVVNFEFPDKLKELIDLKIAQEGVNKEEIKRICETVIKYSVKTSHPHFCNQLFGGVDPYGLAGSWISDALNTSQYTFEVGPVFTLMENEMIQKFCELFGFNNGDGIMTPGGSTANMYGLVLARYRAQPNIKTAGCFNSKPLVAFTSDEAHYSIRKSMQWLGIGSDNLVIIKTDDNGCMIIEDLIVNIEKVLKENRQPFFVNAMAGTTVLGAFDNLNEVANVCKNYQVWMHVDGCLGGSLILSKKYKFRLNGIDRADSIAWNPHKSLGVPLQCSLFLIKDNKLLHECNSSAAAYLFQQDKFYDVSYDTGDKSIQCGRKVDIFKFWLMLKARGFKAFEELMDNAIEKSNCMAKMLSNRDGYKLVRPSFQFTNVSFWYIPKRMRSLPEKETLTWWNNIYKIAPLIKEKMMLKGDIMIGYTPLPSKNIGNFFRITTACFPPLTEETITDLIENFESVAEQV